MFKVFRSLVLAVIVCLGFSSAGLAAGGRSVQTSSTPDPPSSARVEILDLSPSLQPASLFIYNQPFQGEWFSTDRDIFVEVDSFLETLSLSESESSALKEKFRTTRTVEQNGKLFVSLRSVAKILHGKLLRNPVTGVADFTRFHGATIYKEERASQKGSRQRIRGEETTSSSQERNQQPYPQGTLSPFEMGYQGMPSSSSFSPGLNTVYPSSPTPGYPAFSPGFFPFYGYYPGPSTYFPGYPPAFVSAPCPPTHLPPVCPGPQVTTFPGCPPSHFPSHPFPAGSPICIIKR